MPVFSVICRDKPSSVDLRMATRPDHLDYLKSSGTKVWIGGPMLDDDEKPIGSVLLIEAASKIDAQKFADGDPYAKAGLFDSVEIRLFKFTLGEFLDK